jgi:hypothetical protein
MAAKSEGASMKSKTRPLREISSTRGNVPGKVWSTALAPQKPTGARAFRSCRRARRHCAPSATICGVRIFRVTLFAFCLAVLAEPQEARESWAVYGEKNSRPEFEAAEIEQGGQLHFQIASNFLIMGSNEAIPYTKPLGQVKWSIQPSVAGVSVRADGTVIVAANAPAGGYKITAKAGDESRSCDFLVYNPRSVPLTGEWTERAEISCGGPEVTPRRPRIGEFIFHAGGDFSETLVPFETRKDMWGKYTYDVKTEKLVLRLDYSAYLPRDTPLEGSARVDDRDRLVIRGIWLGTPSADSSDTGARKGAPKTFCGYVFARTSSRH